MKTTLPLETARALAEDYLRMLAPSCRRIEIAGSIRRKKAQVGDIELVAIPRMAEARNLFGELVDEVSLLDDGVRNLVRRGAQVVKNGPKFKQLRLPEGITLDLFIVTPPADWGVIFTLRTGPARFSRWCVTPRYRGGGLPLGAVVREGAVWFHNRTQPMPEESDFLAFLGLPPHLPPERRDLRQGAMSWSW